MDRQKLAKDITFWTDFADRAALVLTGSRPATIAWPPDAEVVDQLRKVANALNDIASEIAVSSDQPWAGDRK